MNSDMHEWLAQAKALVFDFDGTLVDSDPIKRRAFETCFDEFPQERKAILDYCCGNPHIPRGEKFRFAYEQILHLPFTQELEAQLHKRFEELTTRQIMQAPSIPGAERFLQRTRISYRMALLSSTPHEILTEIVRARSWLEYFNLIQGAPVEKAVWLKSLCERKRVTPQLVVLFGDTAEDRSSAEQAHCTFVAVGVGWEGIDVPFHIRDFTELLPWAP